jgi:hypothetical protein
MGTFHCPNCKSIVQMQVDGKHKEYDSEGPGELEYLFGHCVRCNTSALVREWASSPETVEYDQLYPAKVRAHALKLPPRVDVSYKEAILCLDARAWLATAVMVRRTLEAVGKEFDPNARTLLKGLEALHAKGAISDELKAWGTELRFLGNIGAHPSDDEISYHDATEAVEFLNAIIETIYHLRPKFQAMQARRTKNGAKDAASASDDPTD